MDVADPDRRRRRRRIDLAVPWLLGQVFEFEPADRIEPVEMAGLDGPNRRVAQPA